METGLGEGLHLLAAVGSTAKELILGEPREKGEASPVRGPERR
jgi:hypothetical protein